MFILVDAHALSKVSFVGSTILLTICLAKVSKIASYHTWRGGWVQLHCPHSSRSTKGHSPSLLHQDHSIFPRFQGLQALLSLFLKENIHSFWLLHCMQMFGSKTSI
jgi:hypothetical protein